MKANNPDSSLASAAAAVSHSSKCLRETSKRHSVRTIASKAITAWLASNAADSAICPAVVRKARRDCRSTVVGGDPVTKL